jgi:hypothetical protein
MPFPNKNDAMKGGHRLKRRRPLTRVSLQDYQNVCIANSYSESIPANFTRKKQPLNQRKPRDSRTSGLVQESENISPVRPSNYANIPLPFANRYSANAQLLSEVNLTKFELRAPKRWPHCLILALSHERDSPNSGFQSFYLMVSVSRM